MLYNSQFRTIWYCRSFRVIFRNFIIIVCSVILCVIGVPYHHLVFRAIHVTCDVALTIFEKLSYQVCKRSVFSWEQRGSGKWNLIFMSCKPVLDTSNIREYISWCSYKELRTVNWLILIIKQVSVDEEEDDEDDDAAKVCADLGFFS